MPPNLRKASERLSTWVDEVRDRLSHVSCCDELTAALLSFMRHAAKVTRAVSFAGDDSSEEECQRLSKELLTVLYQISAHLHLRSRDFLASSSCWGQFAYWEHQCALLSYVVDLGLACNNLRHALSRVCYILLKNRHLVWDVLVRTRAISASREALDAYQKLAAWCPRSCASAELYFKFVVCAVCLARQQGPGSGWRAVKCIAMSIEPAAFDFLEWFTARPALVALLPASSMPQSGRKLIAALCNHSALDLTELLRECRAMAVTRGTGSCIRSACDAEAAKEDMFTFVDDHDDMVAPEQEDAAAAPKVEDKQLRGILDSTLRRIPSAVVSPRATDTEPNSELISEAGSSLRITDSFLKAFLGSPSPERSGPRKQARERRPEFARPPSPQPAKKLKGEPTSGEDPGGSKGGKTAVGTASGDEIPALEDSDPSKDADCTSLQREKPSGAKNGAHTEVAADSPDCTSGNSILRKTDQKGQGGGGSKKRPAQGGAKGTPASTPELAECAPRKRHQDSRIAPTLESEASAATTKQDARDSHPETPGRQEHLSSHQSNGSEDSSEVVSVVRAKGASSGTDERSASKEVTRLAVTSSSEAEDEEVTLSQPQKSQITRKLSTASDDSSGSEGESEESEGESEGGAAETASRQCRQKLSNSEGVSSATEVTEGRQGHHQKPKSFKYPSPRHGVQSGDGSEAESVRGSGCDTSPQNHKSSSPCKLQGGSESESEESGPLRRHRSVIARKAKPCVIADSSEQESCDERVEASVGGPSSHDVSQPEVGSSPGSSDPGGKPSRGSRSPSGANNARKCAATTPKAAGAKLQQQQDSHDSSATNESSESESCGEMTTQKKSGKSSTGQPDGTTTSAKKTPSRGISANGRKVLRYEKPSAATDDSDDSKSGGDAEVASNGSASSLSPDQSPDKALKMEKSPGAGPVVGISNTSRRLEQNFDGAHNSTGDENALDGRLGRSSSIEKQDYSTDLKSRQNEQACAIKRSASKSSQGRQRAVVERRPVTKSANESTSEDTVRQETPNRLAVTSSSEAEEVEATLSQRQKSRITRKLSSTASDDSSRSEDASEDESAGESEGGAAETASRQRRKKSNSEGASSAAEIAEGPQGHHQKPKSFKYPSPRHAVQFGDGSEAESVRGSGCDTSPQSHKSSSPRKLQGGSEAESEESGPLRRRRSVIARKAKPCMIADSSEQETSDERVEASVRGPSSHDVSQPEVGSSPGNSDPGGKPSRVSRLPSGANNARKCATTTPNAAGAKLQQQKDSDDSSATNDSSESESCSEMTTQKKSGKSSPSEQRTKLADRKLRRETPQIRRMSRSAVEVRPSLKHKVHSNRIGDSSEEDVYEGEVIRASNEKPAASSLSADEIPCGQQSPGYSQQQSSQASSLVSTADTPHSALLNVKTGKEESICADESGDSSDYESPDCEATKEAAKLPALQQRQRITASSDSSVELDGEASNRRRASHLLRQQKAKSSPSRPFRDKNSDLPENKSPAREFGRGSSKQPVCRKLAASSVLKVESTHNVQNGQQDVSSSPRETAASATANGKPARDPEPKRKLVTREAKSNTSASLDSQGDCLAVESEADTVDLSADEEPASSGQRRRGSSLSQASTVMASPERRSLSWQRERTPAVEGERRVPTPTGNQKRPSEECPVFKLPQLMQTPKSAVSCLPSRSYNVGASTGQPDGTTTSAKKTPSRGISANGRKVLRDGKPSAATDDSDDSKTGSDADIGSDGSASSLSPDQSPDKALKMEKSPGAGPVAGTSNISRQLEENFNGAHNSTGDENALGGRLARSSSMGKQDYSIDLKSRQNEQACAIKRSASKSPQGRQRSVVERRPVTKSANESTSEDTVRQETPNRRSRRMLSNGKEALAASPKETSCTEQSEHGRVHLSSVSQTANELSSSSDEDQVPLGKLGAATVSVRKRQLLSKAADSMPQGTPFRKDAGAIVSKKRAAKRGKEPAASRMTVSERELTTESQDSDSEPLQRFARAKSSRLEQTLIPKAGRFGKVKVSVSPNQKQLLSSMDNRNVMTDASQSEEMERCSNNNKCSNTHINSVRSRSSTPRVPSPSNNFLLQDEELLNGSECISSALLPVPSLMDAVQASAACSSITDPSTSRGRFAVSVGRGHVTVPGCERATGYEDHMTLMGASDEDALTKLSQASNNLSGLTQKPCLFLASSEEERSNPRSSARRRSLRKRHSPETMEQFVIDYDEQVPPSFSDTDDDDDPLFEVQRRANIAISAADFERSVPSLPSPPNKGKQTPQNTPPNNNTTSEKPGPTRAGRLSLTAIRANSSLSPAATRNVSDRVTQRNAHRDEGDGCQQRQERSEESVCNQAEKNHDSTAVAARTGDTSNARALRRSARISGRFSGCASARVTGNSAGPTSVLQVTPLSGRSRSLGHLNEEVESTPASETLQFRRAPREGNVEAAVQKRRGNHSTNSTPELSSHSLNGDSSDTSDATEQITPVKVVAERIEDTVVRAQSRCFTCSSCSRSFSETTPRMRDSETMTDESSFRQGEAPSGPSKRRKESDDNSSSPSKSASPGRRSSSASRGRREPTRCSQPETSRRHKSTISRHSAAATVTRSTGLRSRRLRQTVTAPRRLSYM